VAAAKSVIRQFEDVALPHLDLLYSVARRLCGNGAEAEDMVQEAFLRALNGFEGFDLRSYGAKPWLLKILHNVCYSNRQRRLRQPTLLEDVDIDGIARELEVPAGGYDGLQKIPWEQLDDELKRAIDRLTPEYAVVLLLWAVEDLTYREIAEICDCPVGTVMSRLYRARQLLMDELASYAEERHVQKQRAK